MKRVMLAGVLVGGLAGCVTPAAEDTTPSQTDAASPRAEPLPIRPVPPSPAPMAVPSPPQSVLKELTLVRRNIANAPSSISVPEDEIPARPTRILDQAMAERLFGNTGITVQWIGWEKRGRTWIAVDEDGYWTLLGGQEGTSGEVLDIEGFITEIGPDYFIYDGTIKILGTPDKDRQCNATKRGWRFGITQNRKYWRLREFEWCDALTDYIDIYF